MDEAEHGVIFFSLGSMMRSDSLPVEKRDALLGAFAKLPQRVLWKFETDEIPLPPNVRIGKWLPQMAVLSEFEPGGNREMQATISRSYPGCGFPQTTTCFQHTPTPCSS